MRANDAAFTPSINAAVAGHDRSLGIKVPLPATRTNAGRKIPTVASNAAVVPPSR
jgi:hypothetical protein